MSIARYITLDCDGIGCNNSYHTPGQPAAEELRRLAYEQGWRRRRGAELRLDLCPDCACGAVAQAPVSRF